MSSQSDTGTPGIKSAAPRTERRVTVRYSSGGTSSCKPLGALPANRWEAAIGNISQDGIGLVLGRRFEPGAILAIEPGRSTERSPHLLLVRVVRVTKQREGSWLMGCTLVNPLTAEELQAML